jgi:hypothetical protein
LKIFFWAPNARTAEPGVSPEMSAFVISKPRRQTDARRESGIVIGSGAIDAGSREGGFKNSSGRDARFTATFEH